MQHFRYVLFVIGILSSYAQGIEPTSGTAKTLEEMYAEEKLKCRERYDKGEHWDTKRLTEADMAYLLDRELCFKECLARYQAALTAQLLMEIVDETLKDFKKMKDKAS